MELQGVAERRSVGLAVSVVACAWLLALPPVGARADEVVRAGALAAHVGSQPWSLRFTDGSGGTLLQEVTGTGLGPSGTLGFRSAGRWFHATRIISLARRGQGVAATVATTDPLGRTLRVVITPAQGGVVRVRAGGPAAAEAMGIAFAAQDGERFLGFGERSNAVDQRGREVESHVAEGPYQPIEEPFIIGFVPPPGYRPREDATYFPIPWLLSTRGYGVLLAGNDTNLFRLGTDRGDAWSMEIESSRIDFRVFAGPRPADALRRFTEHVGRQPPAAAPFYFGPWWQPKDGHDDDIRTLRRAGALGSVAQTYTHYLPCGDHQGRREQQRELTEDFHDAGLAVTTYFNPMICTSYQPRYGEARAREVLAKNALGQPYEYRYTGSTVFFVGQFDFTAPGAVKFYGDLLQEALDDGYDGWMEDFGEYTPTDVRSADGTPGPEMHNRYPLLYHGAARHFARHRSPRPLARFNRSGWTGAARVSQIVWGGDPTTSWGFDGLESAVRNGLTMGLSGVSLWGSDIGGFFALSEPQTTPELNRRWIQFGFASGVMRTQANGFELRPSRRSQILDPDVLGVWQRYARLRTQLYPYLAAAERRYDRTGMPIMRHLALEYPDDPEATAREDEYLFGPDLLVAPVLEPGATTREAYLPRGRWIDLWRSVRVREDGSLRLVRPRDLEGREEVEVPAPADEIPLFVRAGAVLALLPADVETLADYGRSAIRLRDRRDRRTLLAWPARDVRGKAEPDAGEVVTSTLHSDRWVLKVEGDRERRYDIQAALPDRPCDVDVEDGDVEDDWEFEDGVLRVSVRMRRGAVVARMDC